MEECRHILESALAAHDPLLPAEAARLIGDWKRRSLIPDLIENILTSRFYSKVAAIDALARLGAREAIPSLETLVTEPNVPDDFYWTGFKGVRAAASIALLQFGNPAGTGYLHKLASDRSEVFFRWYAPALLRLNAAPELQAELTMEKLCSREHRDACSPEPYSDPGMLCMLCEALGLIDDPAADDDLEFYMNFHSRYVRGQAYRSLYLRHGDEATAQKISDRAATHGTEFDLLVSAEIRRDSAALLGIAGKAESAFDRASAIDALATISSPNACETGLDDEDPQVRKCAVERLARTRPADARSRLGPLLAPEEDPGVRCALAAVILEEQESR